ncbi:MAG: hypothetical protein SFV54_24260 [Bryobacteraceae bacterium]|nr:hypothetical protein [Bryobacteraceae bacterium]
MKRFILWDYPRAGWQYDLMVGLILAFIFLTPREWFRDQPRAGSIVMLPAEQQTNVYWLEPDLLLAVPEERRFANAAELLKAQKRLELVRLEPIFDSEQEIRGFMAYTRR